MRVADVWFSYPDGRAALRGLDLTIEEGERVALIGPNGAGKTTLALHLNGVLRADTGEISIVGLEMADENLKEIRRRVGLVFQDPNDQLFMPSVRDDVAFGPANLGFSGERLEERVTEALEMVDGLEFADRPPHHLSGGEKNRAALATVLAMEPDVVVFDEPSSGLDPAGRRDSIETLRRLPMTQLIITHDMPLALELCSRAVIVSGGRVVASGASAEIFSDADLLARHRLEFPHVPSPGTHLRRV